MAGADEDGGALDDVTLGAAEDDAGLDELTEAEGDALAAPMLAGGGNAAIGWPASAASM